MPSPVHLTAAAYAYRDAGGSVFQTLQDMHSFETIRLIDAALIEKRDDGKLHVVAVADHTQSGGHGRAIKGLIQHVFPRHLTEESLTAADVEQAAVLLGELHIDAATLHTLLDDLPAHGSLVLALAEAEWSEPIANTLRGYEGKLVHIELSPDMTAAVVAASEPTA